MPLRVWWFLWRARRLARRRGHTWGIEAATRRGDLAELLRLAAGRSNVVELGTGPGWTALALALADPDRRVTTFDPVVHDHRDAYAGLAGQAAARVEWVNAPGVEARGDGVELLFVDSTHEREPTIAEFQAWRDRLAPGAVVAFHDCDHPSFPGVREAVEALGLPGERRGGMFVTRV